MNPWISLLATVFGALLTAVLGNRLVQYWQQRNWFHQQQFSGLEKEYVSLKSLTDAINRDCGSRLAAMRDLNGALKRGEYTHELQAYRVVISAWNSQIHVHYAQLTFQMEWAYAKHFEVYVHEAFVEVGRAIEAEVRHQKNGDPRFDRCASIDRSLNDLAGQVADFSRRLVRATEERRQEVFYGREVKYSRSDIIRLGNFDLIKLLFESNIDNFSVVRPTADVRSPLGRRL